LKQSLTVTDKKIIKFPNPIFQQLF